MKTIASLAMAGVLLGTAVGVSVTPALAVSPRSPWVNNHPLDGDYGSYAYRRGYVDHGPVYYRRAYPYPYAYYDDDWRYHRHYRHYGYHPYSYGAGGTAAALFGSIAGTIIDEIDD